MRTLERAILLLGVVLSLHLFSACGQDDPDLPVLSVDRVYVYGEKISFAAGGDSYRFTTSGWSHPEPAGTWSDGVAASLTFRVPATKRPLRVSAKLSAHIKPPVVEAQFVHVYVRGEKIATWRVADAAVFTALIPRQFAGSGGLVNIDLHIPGAVSPQQIGSGADSRRLGIQCSEMTISEADALENTRAYALGTVIAFGAGRGSERYKVSGWSSEEKDFTWTEGRAATLQMDVPPSAGPLSLRTRMRGIGRSAQLPFQPTDVFVNGEKVAHWEVGEPAEFRVDIPPALLAGTGSLLVEFRTPMAIAPSELGGNSDTRVLGLCVFELQITGR